MLFLIILCHIPSSLFSKCVFSPLCQIPLCQIPLCSIPISCYTTFRYTTFRYTWFQIAHLSVITDSCSPLYLIPLSLIALYLIPVLIYLIPLCPIPVYLIPVLHVIIVSVIPGSLHPSESDFWVLMQQYSVRCRHHIKTNHAHHIWLTGRCEMVSWELANPSSCTERRRWGEDK